MSRQHRNTRIGVDSRVEMPNDASANSTPSKRMESTQAARGCNNSSNPPATPAYHSSRRLPLQDDEPTHTHTTPTRKLVPQNEHHSPPWRSQDQSQRFGDRADRKLNSFSPPPPLSHRPASSADQQQHQHQHQNKQQESYVSSPPSTPQDQLERLAAEASSVVGGITGTTPLRSESPLRYESTSSSYNSSLSGGSYNYGYSRDRLPQPLDSVPETDSSSNAATSTPTSMSSSSAPQMVPTTPNPSRAIPRTSSIDSAVSSVSAQSGTSHAHSSSTSSNNAFSHITGNSPADIQALIQVAGSPEELIRYMLKEKQSVTAQNSQLWRLVDKQRAMILGLNKDLERAMKEKDRYRKKLKEHMGMIPPIPTNSSIETVTPSRTLNESPAPSIDETQSRSESTSPPRGSGVARTDSLASSVDRSYTSSALDVAIAPYPSTPSPTHPQPIISPAHERMPSPTEHAHQPTDSASLGDGSSRDTNLSDDSLAVEFREPREAALPDVLHDDEDRQIETSIQISPKTTPGSRSTGVQEQLSEGVPQVHIRSESINHANKLGLYTAVAPAIGLGKSPFRKAPPAPLDLPYAQPQNQVQNDKNVEDPSGHSDDSWQATPDDKKGLSVPLPRFLNNGPLTAPPTRQPPAPYLQNIPLTPNPSSLEMSRRLSPDADAPRIGARFVGAPLPSPGLPSSPRPIDRPAGSPMPRTSRNFSLDSTLQLGGLTAIPQPLFQSMAVPGTPRTSVPLASPRFPFPNGHERGGSDGSSVASHQKSASIDLVIQPSAIATVDSRVVSSRLKPSRASMLPGKPRSSVDDSVFTLGVFSRTDGKEILRVEKDVGALSALDAKLRKHISYTAKVPDRALFTGYAPARMDARRTATDEYFAGVLKAAATDERASLLLCEFFSTDVVEHYPNNPFEAIKEGTGTTDKSLGSTIIKEGYLTKRGKNFGGWKERYFVLDAPVLKYFDSPGGAQLGQIKLHNAQIGRQSSKTKDDSSVDEDSQYRHAFLVLEPKRKDSATLVRHVLCAENDKERDEWVNALLEYVTTDKEEDIKRKPKHSKSKESKENKEAKDGGDDGKDDSSLRSMSYDEVTQGPAPARGPTPEELSRQQVSPSPNSMLSQPTSQQFSSTSPVPDRSYPPKQISAPSNGTVISDLAAWGALKLGTQNEDKKAEKAAKKRSIWGFRQRSSSDLDDQIKQGPQTGYQQAVERFPLSKPVFDVSLPAVVYRCIEYLDANNASDEEGIFRLSGSNVVIKGLKEKFNSECDFNLLANDEYYDVHAISGLLKLYLRELPTSILTSERRDDFVRVTEMEDKNQKVSALNDLVHSLPVENFALLKALSGHLLRIVDNSSVNKMTIRNVGIVFSPTLNIPAQVFSMFLHEYRYIFFRNGEASPPLQPPQPPQSPKAMMSPRKQTFDLSTQSLSASRMMDPPLTPMMPTHPAAIRPPGSQPQVISYEPTYDGPTITSPTQISAPRFDLDLNSPVGSSGGSLSVPGSEGKNSKSRRRESSMMFMMGGLKKSNAFQPSKSNAAMVEEDLYG
ncbi:hypothetical protein BDD12DRAFT_978261 [Trichophaea hybrida]|nr:hypothetical protein BDD12DRAFT_978261 [Trichophaea hybrida]